MKLEQYKKSILSSFVKLYTVGMKILCSLRLTKEVGSKNQPFPRIRQIFIKLEQYRKYQLVQESTLSLFLSYLILSQDKDIYITIYSKNTSQFHSKIGIDFMFLRSSITQSINNKS